MFRSRATELPAGEPIILFAIIIVILYFARELLIPLAFALTLTFLLAPAVTGLEKLRLSRLVSVAIVVIVTFASLVGVGYIVSRQLVNVAKSLPAYRQNIHARMTRVHSATEQNLENAFTSMEEIGVDLAMGASNVPANSNSAAAAAARTPPVNVQVIDPARSQVQGAADLFMRILKPIGTLGIVIVFTIYLLMKREELRNRLLLLAGMGHLNIMTQALEDAASRISQYLIMQVVVNACYGLLFGFGLYVIGIPNATLWGALAGLLRIIPYVGTATGLILPLVVSIAISQTWWPPVLILCLFLVLELSATNFVEPWLYSSRTGISSLALLATAIFWTLIWGWPGLILSTPLTVCMVVLGRYVPQMSFLHILLGTDAELSAEAQLYERLLAMDQQEAHAIADRYLVGKPLVTLYDTVLIPTLALAEQDRHKGVLDDIRSDFLFLSIGELVAELTDYTQKGDEAAAALPPPRPSTTNKEFAVVCISVSDQADELATLMLAQLLERAGHPTILLTAASVSAEILQGLSEETDTVIFISALPPFAFSQARSICQRVRGKLPENRIVVGLWNTPDDTDQLLDRFGSGKPNLVVGTLSQALHEIAEWQENATIPQVRQRTPVS